MLPSSSKCTLRVCTSSPEVVKLCPTNVLMEIFGSVSERDWFALFLTVKDNASGLISSRLADFLFWNFNCSSTDPFSNNGSSLPRVTFPSTSTGEWTGDPTLRMTSGVCLVAASVWICWEKNNNNLKHNLKIESSLWEIMNRQTKPYLNP